MRRVTYKSVLLKASGLLQGPPAGPDTRVNTQLNIWINRRLRFAWEYYWWPELTTVEQRQFRTSYASSTSYSAPTLTATSEVYYIPTGQYYQALRAMPLSVTSITRSSSTATLTTTAAHGLATGDRVQVQGAAETEYNIIATITVTGASTFTYEVTGTPSTPATGTITVGVHCATAAGTVIPSYWAESLGQYSGTDWAEGESYALGDIVRYDQTDRFYACHTAHTSTSVLIPSATGSSSRWGVLTPFVRDVDYEQTAQTAIGEIRAVWPQNPRLVPRGSMTQIRCDLTDTGIIVRGGENRPWIEFRLQPPSFTGSAWSSASISYAEDDQVYYDTTGDFYKAAQAHTSDGAKVPTDTTFWTRIDFPYVLAEYVAQGAYADALGKGEGQQDKYGTEADEAFIFLERELDKLTRAQGQHAPLPMVVNL